jgi:hypothetical protein
MTKSLHSALDTLRLDRAYVVHAGEHTFPMDDRVTALAATAVHETLAAS